MSNPVVESIIAILMPVLTGGLGAVLAVVLLSGLGLIGLYFLNTNFRRAYNLFSPPRGRQARYSRSGAVYRAGWAFDDEDGRWRFVSRDDEFSAGYTRYRRRSNAD